MVSTASLGFPRIGAQRQLKFALEQHWRGELTAEQLAAVAKQIRAGNWQRQAEAGIDVIPSGDFALYDHVLNHTVMFDCIPPRYDALRGTTQQGPLALYFAMARGHQRDGIDVVACDMTKWFDTNYHYIAPEFTAATEFRLAQRLTVEQFLEAKALGIATRPVVLGPVTYLSIGKAQDGSDPLALLPRLLPVYVELLTALKEAGATSVQIDEPVLALDLSVAQREALTAAFDALRATGVSLTLATYFAGLRDNTELAFALPVDEVHVDLVREPEQLCAVLAAVRPGQRLSLGVVDGRNVWVNDMAASLRLLEAAKAVVGADRIVVAPSCSLLHSPVDLASEAALDAEIKQWMAFALQKLTEVATLGRALRGGGGDAVEAASVRAALEANAAAVAARRSSPRIHNAAVGDRLCSLKPDDMERRSPFAARLKAQRARLALPLLPTTTIGSFPQTAEVRKARAEFKAGRTTEREYHAFLEQATADCIRKQEALGLDVLVHGEFERNDMVEYFGEQLEGFAFTKNGWVQSYGSRCVKPPIIFGDVWRAAPMTVRWSTFAQTLTARPMKGMLTGPVCILQWSFVRDDQARETTCKQIALAIRDEVVDLEAAGIAIIQIDEAALREGLPLRRADRESYLRWAVDSFRIAACGVRDDTQVHTHMCYSEFNDIIAAVARMDADAISIETSRSNMELLQAFAASSFRYPNHIGPGVYDIHSPRVPSEAEMTALLRKALSVLDAEQVWVNPDCGLKTRGWPEVLLALEAMVAAAAALRSELQQQHERS